MIPPSVTVSNNIRRVLVVIPNPPIAIGLPHDKSFIYNQQSMGLGNFATVRLRMEVLKAQTKSPRRDFSAGLELGNGRNGAAGSKEAAWRFKVKKAYRRHSSINEATRPVQPVWCEAPTPWPVSPWKYS